MADGPPSHRAGVQPGQPYPADPALRPRRQHASSAPTPAHAATRYRPSASPSADLLTFARPDGTAATLTSLTLGLDCPGRSRIRRSRSSKPEPPASPCGCARPRRRTRPVPGRPPTSRIAHVLTDHGLGHVRTQPSTPSPAPDHRGAGVVIPWKPS
ncbi:hypothetical protein QJS66_19535 [Kocuria rhizophila]|nr:hypothetical protein QJS66_19535 [Kocuria rhizophila]